MTRFPTLRSLRLLAWVLAVGLSATRAFAGTAIIGVALDTDNNAATGCAVSTANGSVSGIDLVALTVVTTTGIGATVARLERQVCGPSALGAPAVYDNGGWNVGLGNGTAGSAVVEMSIPLALLPRAGTMKAVVISSNGTGGQDATAPFSITVSAAAAAAGAGPIAVPLTPWLVPPLALLLLATTLWLRRRYPGQTGALVMLAAFGVSGLVWAAVVSRNGNVDDWKGVPAATTDASGDAPVNADLVAVFYQQDGTNLYLRVDADIQKDAPGNAQPTVNAGTNQTITLPAGASLSGTASDDDLPDPPGALTLTWSKTSGPGTVSFGNAGLAVTTATFSAPGTYVLQLAAFDGALTGSATVTINVNAGGGANLAPTAIAGADQTITLPAVATLAGTATDDGLPAPPGALTTTWSVVSGPGAGVLFANANAPGTTATFLGAGTYVLRLTADDGAMAVSSTVQINVNDGAPLFGPIADRTILLGSRFQLLLQASDRNINDALTYSLLAAPSGATLNPSPLIDWTPTAAQLGSHTFTVMVTDAAGHPAQTTFQVTVVRSNQQPQLAPQANVILPVGTAFSRTLQATDPDAGDTLIFALVSGPNGMTLTGADLNWSTSGRTPGDYAVTVKVTDSAGESDQKSFTLTLTLQQAAPPIAVDDNYQVRVNQSLTVPPTGVLDNDLNPSNKAITAVKLSDPALGSLTAFNADGSFTFVAPASPPGTPLGFSEAWRNTFGGDGPRQYPLVGDVNGDGFPDLLMNHQQGPRAVNGLTGATLWNLDLTGYTDCRADFAWTNAPLLADVDDDGELEYVGSLLSCARDNNGGANGVDRIYALDATTGRVKWQSDRLSASLGDVLAPGTPPSTEDRFQHVIQTAQFVEPYVTRFSAGAPPTILLRKSMRTIDGVYPSIAGPLKFAGCRALTGLAADDGKGCRATILINGVDGALQQILTAPNPTNQSQITQDPWREQAPFTVDIDGDGQLEIVSGSDVWKNVGGTWTLLWQSHYEPIQTLAADLDGDGKPEIVHLHVFDKTGGLPSTSDPLFGFNGLFIRDALTGAELRRIRLPIYWTAWLTIADVDGDNAPDFVFNTHGRVLAIATDGRIKWSYDIPPGVVGQTPDHRSGIANVQVYDLDGDGIPEVVTNSHSGIVVLNGRTGAVKLAHPSAGRHGNAITHQNVQLVDADNDGHVDIFASYVSTDIGVDYLLMRGAPNNWLPGPKIHHQVNFMHGDVDDNGRVLFNTAVPTSFRNPKQLGTIRDPRLAVGTVFTYAVNDGTGDSAPANVFIEIKPTNEPPVITSTPPVSLFQRFNPTPPGGLFTNFYQVTAFDPDPGDTLTFSLQSAPTSPAFVTMDANGRVRFEPTCGSFGNPCRWGWTFLRVRVTDSQGAFAEQSFLVNLTTTSAIVPNVVGQLLPAAEAAINAANLTPRVLQEVFALQPAGTVLAQDPIAGAANIGIGDAVRLTVSKGPQPVLMPFVVGMQLAAANSLLTGAGLSVNVSTLFTTTIPAGEVMAQSPAFGTLLLPLTAPPVDLTVSAGPPLAGVVARIIVEPGPATRVAGDTIPYKATAIFGDGTSQDVTFTALWSSSTTAVATVDATGVALAKVAGGTTISAATAGITGQATLSVIAAALGDVAPPTALISAPVDGGAVTGPTPVIGTATDAAFLRYELAIAPADSTVWTLIGEGTSPVTNGNLGTLDPTLLLNGAYILRLSVFDRGSNVTTAEVAILVDGNQKIGYFTLSYTDLIVPLSGIPIQIIRTYDSRDLHKGDFGVGWSLGMKAVRVSTTRELGTGWQVTKSGLNYNLFQGSERFVSVTLPTGRVETFDVKITPTVSPLVPFQTARASFVPRPGALGTLQALENVDLLVVDPQPGPVTLVNDVTLNTFHPDRFLYTQRDGTQFVVTRTRGVESVKDANGNQITISASGISHSTGTSIVFTRDAEDRITGITDPKGNTRTYAYSGAGDLAAATDRLSNTTRYFYNRFHGLLRIEDALGQTPTRADYDEQGRLIAITDANGQKTSYLHDLPGRQELIEDPLGRITVYTYDDRGNILSFADPLGNTSTFTYDARDNVLTRTDPLGATMSYTYDAEDNMTSVTDPLGRSTSTTFDAGGRPLKVTDPRGNFTTARYDAAGELIGTTDALGNIRSYSNDAAGNPTSATNAVGANTRNAYDAIGRRTQLTDALGAVLSFQYDVNGNLLAQQGTTGPAMSVSYDAENRVTGTARGGLQRSLTYDAAGRISAATTATNRQMSLTNDPMGRVTSISDPVDGPVLQYVYDAVGNLQGFGNGSGNQLTNVYDAANRLIETRGPEGSIERRAYDKAGRLVQVVDVRGNATRYGYDVAGQLVSLTDALGGQTIYQYDGSGNRSAQTDPAGRTTRFDYDAANRLVRTTFADGLVESRGYDAEGRLVQLTDPAGQSMTYAYDVEGRLLSITDALGQITRHAYQGSAQRTDTTDANGNTTRFAYDTAGRVVKTTFPLGGMETFTYDIVGNPLSKTNGQGETTQYQYDARGRRSATLLPGGATETYGYTADHLLRTVIDARGTTTLDYDPLTRRLVRVTEPDGRYVRYAYDAAGNKTLAAHSDGAGELVTQYAYDALNRLVRITDPSGAVSTQVWDSTGNLVGVSRPNGVTTQTTYDVRNRPIAISHRNSGGALIAQETYTLDALGNRVRIDRQDGSRVEYRYDALSQVTRELRFDTGGNPVFEAVFAYDAVGNLVSSGPPVAPVVYVYNADNQLVSGGGVTFAYDGAGRRVQESWTPPAGPPKALQYTWDARDRLTGFRDAGGAVSTYAYDAEGVRMGKAGAVGATAFLVDRSNATGFSQLVGRTTAAGSDTFVWATQMLRAIEGGTPRYPLFDALGSTRLLTGASGAVSDTFDYKAYGEPATITGTSGLPHRFAGEETDPESGLSYLRARYYDPRTGRFLSRDAKPGYPGEPMSLNPYLYVAGNPVNRTDPSGNDFSLASTLFASAQSLVVRGQEILKTRKALLSAKKATLTTTRAFAGVMAVGAVMDDVSNHKRVNKWFGGGTVVTAALGSTLPEFGSVLNMGVHVIADGVMALTAFKLLDGEEVLIMVEGVGILTSGSIAEAKEQWSMDSSAGNKCRAQTPDLAWAYRGKPPAMELCRGFFFQPPLPTPETLTKAGKASMPGIFLHEFTHLAAGTQDNAYECAPTTVLALAKSLIPGAGLFNADSYRCWAEDAAIGWVGK